MNLQQIMDLDIKEKNICIIGLPASGKTFLSKLLNDGTRYIIHTDDFIQYGFEQSMYLALDAVKNVIGNYMVEGVQCYRMLRHGLVENVWQPDVIIECERPRHKREQVYRGERDSSKLKYQRNFAITLQKIYNDYLSHLPLDKRPQVITWHNEN